MTFGKVSLFACHIECIIPLYALKLKIHTLRAFKNFIRQIRWVYVLNFSIKPKRLSFKSVLNFRGSLWRSRVCCIFPNHLKIKQRALLPSFFVTQLFLRCRFVDVDTVLNIVVDDLSIKEPRNWASLGTLGSDC